MRQAAPFFKLSWAAANRGGWARRAVPGRDAGGKRMAEQLETVRPTRVMLLHFFH
jgi:hypothetical protein